jgi:ABC-type sugar transport system permease subunit
MLTNIPLAILYSLMIAVILNTRFKGSTAFRAIYFIPVILATGFMAKADTLSAIFSQQWNSMGAADSSTASVANGLIDSMDLRSFFMNLSFSPQLAGYVIGAVDQIFNIVNISGVQMLIFLAGLQSISPSVYEAADIDGSSAWEKFWLITFPMISPIIVVNVVYTIIDSFTDSENAIMTQIREQSFKSSSMGIASAMAWFYFIVIAVCIAVITWIISRYVYYQQRD